MVLEREGEEIGFQLGAGAVCERAGDQRELQYARAHTGFLLAKAVVKCTVFPVDRLGFALPTGRHPPWTEKLLASSGVAQREGEASYS